jgi:tetratricopeptide (TPR) repeat protein
MPKQKSTHVPDPVALGQRLRATREGAGLSQRKLAFPGCTPAYISRVETGNRIPSLQLLRELARRLDVSESFLLSGENESEPELSRLLDAEIALRLGRLEEARRLYQEALDDPGRKHEHLDALTGLGKVALHDGENETAIDYFERALQLFPGGPDELPGLAESLGRAYAQAGQLAPAIALFRQCVRRCETDGDLVGYVRFSCLLGYALTDTGDFGQAEQAIADALERGREVSDPYTRARLYWSQSRVLGEQGQSEASARYARMAVETLRVTEDSYSLALAHQLLAHAYLDAGRIDEATQALREARPLIEASAGPVELAHFEIEEARALAASGHPEQAGALAMSAGARLTNARPVVAARAYTLLGDVYGQLGDHARAKELLELAAEILEDKPHPRYLVDAYRKLAQVFEDQGRTDEALATLKRAVAIQERVGRAIT